MRVTHRFENRSVFQPECIKRPKNRYNPDGYGSLRVTPIACGLEAPKRHGKNTAYLSVCILLILPSEIINNKTLLKYG